MKKRKKPKKRTRRQKLNDKLEKVFSRYIRLKYADDDGNVMCISCGDVKPVLEMQNGHFVSSAHLSGRFNEDNCYPQCYRCNISLGGNYKEYTLALIEELGKDKVDEIMSLKHKTKKISLPEYEQMIEHYEAEVDKLKREKGVSWKD